MANLGRPEKRYPWALSESSEPLYSAEEIYGIVPVDAKKPFDVRDIIARMLRNLKEIHQAQEDWQRLIAVQDRLVILLPEAWAEYRDRGLAHAEQGHAAMAVTDLETYLVHAQDSLDIDFIADRVSELRRAKN